MKEQLRTEAEKERTFRTVKIKDRLPDFGKRILFLDENYDKEFMSEYLPNQEIEIKKGSFIEIKDCTEAIAFIKCNFTHWLEEVDNAMLDFHAQQSKEMDVMTDDEIRELKANEYLKKVGTHDNPDTTKHDFLQGFDTAIKLKQLNK